MRILLLKVIGVYQEYISPLKGFSCAYGVLHKQGSCSSRIYSIIQNEPGAALLPEMSAQFRAHASKHTAYCRRKIKTMKKKKIKSSLVVVMLQIVVFWRACHLVRRYKICIAEV